jgi:GH43 family beta-xylosidase
MQLSSALRRLAQIVVVLCALLPSLVVAQSDAPPPGTFRNPLNQYGGADPWLQYYDDHYYLAATTWSSTLTMRRASSLEGLKTADPVEIYYETDPSRCCNMWAPEFHLLTAPDGSQRWYFYYTAGTAGTYDNQHTHVLESEGTNPLGPYTYKGRVYFPANDIWMIDGSILELNDDIYFLFSSWKDGLQTLFIAPMSNPWTLSAAGVPISQPEYGWEKLGGNVNEGPVALYHGDDTFIIYSASACSTPNYQLGMLTYNGGDPLSAASWVKHPEPVFERSDGNGVYAPGHNGFFQSPDGTEAWIVYHANDSIEYGCDGTRTTRVQPLVWNADGTPNFGEPLSLDTAIVLPSGDTGTNPVVDVPPLNVIRFGIFGRDNAYLRHSAFILRQDFNPRPIADSMFVIVPGLADPAAVSIESFNFPTFYLRNQNNSIVLSPDDRSDSFEADATWWIRPGLADESWISIESYSVPGSYIGQMFGVMALVPVTDATPTRALEDATFREEQ